jgi:putative nucleotidyltransferase with HDIG domain
MEDKGELLVIEDDKKRADLSAILSKLGLRVKAHRCDDSSKEEVRRLKKELAHHLRRARELEEAYDTTLENFMAALDLRDVETYGHSKTVARYTHVLAGAYGVTDPRKLESIRKGALLHDAGKMAVRDVKLVPEVGNIILCHHERYDGKGYPKGLKGESIPLEARIFAVADTLDAVTSHRPYRAPRDFQVARRELEDNAGRQFDPKVVDVFCDLELAVWEKIRFETTRLLPPLDGGHDTYFPIFPEDVVERTGK